jgi:hypothetical protein
MSKVVQSIVRKGEGRLEAIHEVFMLKLVRMLSICLVQLLSFKALSEYCDFNVIEMLFLI